MNQVFRGWLRCMIVPAVTEVSFPQAAHSQLAGDASVPSPCHGRRRGRRSRRASCEMPGAGGFIGKARLEGGAGHRAVVFPAAGHDRTLGEHPADGNRKPNMSSNRGQRDKPLLLFPGMAEYLCDRQFIHHLGDRAGLRDMGACARADCLLCCRAVASGPRLSTAQ